MTYQVLARKWRPRSFKEMAGQSHVLKTLINSLDNNRLHHAYLFTGTRGVGKTTIARILAKCLNCENGVSSEPCGQCSACREIDEGRFIDLIEVDAASRTKVEDTRELLDNVQYSPSRGRFKVYLIDEVHMLSGHSFNALLKTLEEPPPHVKFLLATTDPQKLPVTILSRCLQFNLKNLSPEQIVVHLQSILKQEEIPFDDPALWQLGRAARGSVRDALTLLDQAIAFCEGNIRDAEMRALLGTIDQGIIHQLLDALVLLDARQLLEIVQAAAEHAPDFSAVLEDLLSYLHRVAIAQVVPDGIDNSQGDRDSVLQHAAAIPAENVQLFYQIALKGRDELPLAVDARSGLEMTLLRMLAFTPDGVPASPTIPLAGEMPAAEKENASGSEQLETTEQLKKKHTDSVAVPQQVSAGQVVMPESQAQQASEVPSATASDLAPDPGQALSQAEKRVHENPSRPPLEPASDRTDLDNTAPETAIAEEDVISRATEEIPASPVPAERDPSAPPISLQELAPDNWIPLFFKLHLSGITRSIAANCTLESVIGSKISLRLDQSQANVFNSEHEARIRRAFSDYFGEELALHMAVAPITGETPQAFRVRKEQERLSRAIEVFENDANVQEILTRFSGTIVTDSIKPLSEDSRN